jgi:hypothetical protein
MQSASITARTRRRTNPRTPAARLPQRVCPPFGTPGPPDLPESILATGLRPLSIDPTHAIAAGRLPPLHRDPFDRMLVAQARVEGLTLATRNPLMQSYDVPVLKV